jgi:hypothetical protein
VSIAPVVTAKDRLLWEEYIVSNEPECDWIENTILYQKQVGVDVYIKDYGTSFRGNVSKPHLIQREDSYTGQVTPLKYGSNERYLPFWEMSPFLRFEDVNSDMMQEDDHRGFYGELCLKEGAIVVGAMEYRPPGGIDSPDATTSAYAQLLSIEAGKLEDYKGDPMSNLFIPIFDSFEDNRVPKAVLVGLFNWGNLFKGVLPETTKGVDIVLQDNCDDYFTYRVIGEEVIPLGKGVSGPNDIFAIKVR